MTVWDETALRAEADVFHRALFGSPAPEVVAERYARAHTVCFASVSEAERDSVERIVRQGLDAEAIECAYRLQGRRHLLTGKLHVMLYLAEVRREHYHLFVGERAAPVMGKLRLIAAVLGAGVTILRGFLLIRRYGLG